MAHPPCDGAPARMMAKQEPVKRPHKRDEYIVQFGSRGSQEGWNALKATKLNAVVDAWDFLTRTPTASSEKCHPLRGDLATVTRDGQTHVQWQLELPGGARIWYYVPTPTSSKSGTVVLIRVATSHPNETK